MKLNANVLQGPRLATMPHDEDGTQKSLQQNEQGSWLHRLLPRGRPRVMTQENAKAQGLFIPNWWLAILFIPIVIGVLWVFKSLSDIQAANIATAQVQAANAMLQTQALQSLKDTVEFRLKNMETQGRLNDEHLRQIENRIARIEGKKNIQTVEPDQ